MNTTLVRRVVFAVIFLATFGIYVMRASTSGALREPPETGDGHDYDAIAFNVWQGRGFGYEWSDENWRALRRIPGTAADHSPSIHPTTYRPPAMPYSFGVYAVTGTKPSPRARRQLRLTAGAVTTAAIISAQFAGTCPAG